MKPSCGHWNFMILNKLLAQHHPSFKLEVKVYGTVGFLAVVSCKVPSSNIPVVTIVILNKSWAWHHPSFNLSFKLKNLKNERAMRIFNMWDFYSLNFFFVKRIKMMFPFYWTSWLPMTFFLLCHGEKNHNWNDGLFWISTKKIWSQMYFWYRSLQVYLLGCIAYSFTHDSLSIQIENFSNKVIMIFFSLWVYSVFWILFYSLLLFVLKDSESDQIITYNIYTKNMSWPVCDGLLSDSHFNEKYYNYKATKDKKLLDGWFIALPHYWSLLDTHFCRLPSQQNLSNKFFHVLLVLVLILLV